MITRVYIENYKAIASLAVDLASRSLLIGSNGSGKTSVFEVVDLIRNLMLGATLAVPTESLTRWQTLDVQTFQVDVRVSDHDYRYTLEVSHRREAGDCQIKSEILLVDGGQKLFSSENGKAQLFRDNGNTGPEVLSDWSRSSLPVIAGRSDNKLLTRFVEWVTKDLILCRINPILMRSHSNADSTYLAADLSNFASWWRFVRDENVDAATDLKELVHEAMPGFRGLELRKITDKAKRLMARFGDLSYGFDELSDGQRVLIALYALLVYARNRSASLFLDEPDNFVSLREIQPFFNGLEASDSLQCTIISHHPTMINLMAAESGIVFRRGGTNSPVRIEAFQVPSGSTLTASEIMARGYFDELG